MNDVNTDAPSVTAHYLWQLLQLSNSPLQFFDRCAKQYGDCFTAQMGPQVKLAFFSHPEAIAKIMTAPANQFAVGPANEPLRPILGDYSLLLLDGDRHRQHRHLLMPPLHGDRLNSYGDITIQLVQEISASWQVGQPLNLFEQLREISLRAILQPVGFSHPLQIDRFRDLLDQVWAVSAPWIRFVRTYLPAIPLDWWSPMAQFLRVKQTIDAEIEANLIQRQQSSEDYADILSLLLASRDEAGNGLSLAEIRDEVLTLLLAGRESVAASVSWALVLLHQYPSVLDRLMNEFRQLAPAPSPVAVTQLPYLTAVIQETLRLYPITVITNPRIAQAVISISGYRFEPQTRLIPCIYLTHRRADIYANPEQFCPERFLERSFSPYEYLPFGGGNRRCIGAAFALYQMKLVLWQILSQHRFTLRSVPQPVRHGTTLVPKGGLWMALID